AVEAGHAPATVAPGRAEMRGVVGDGVGMVAVHVLDRAALGGGDGVEPVAGGQEILPRQGESLAEAAVEARALRLQPVEGEVAEAGIELRLGIVRQEAPFEAAVARVVPGDLL